MKFVNKRHDGVAVLSVRAGVEVRVGAIYDLTGEVMFYPNGVYALDISDVYSIYQQMHKMLHKENDGADS